ncbi:hypothetical protein LARV_02783 [Longilinea arvoryzae]|uniref:Uncharacterized protein n=1 Tax=Longilinea arvoryzae TaxID=360412 RepID=A0A0S7BLY1_9CHLR|nr:hypothetical protein [Longilinea arvoryzae]GAP15003.1 hypothetical protein LARV_02783 [Longilinea arvoryzae]
MAKRNLSITFFILLIFALASVAMRDSVRCSDPAGCIQVGPERPLEIGVLVSPPGVNCPTVGPEVENLETLAANIARQKNIPLTIVKEETGFSLASSQQTLARLLSRSNLAAVWVQDCQFGDHASLQKLIADARIDAWFLDSLDPKSELENKVNGLVGRIRSGRTGPSNRFLIGRSWLREEE